MIAVAIARHLEQAGIVNFDEAGPAGDTFLGHMPSQPDAAVMIQPSGGDPASGTLGYDAPVVQVIVRGAGYDQRLPYQRARAIYAALHGLHHVTLDPGGPDEVFVVGCLAQQSDPVPLGPDDNERQEFSLNFALETRALTTNRS